MNQNEDEEMKLSTGIFYGFLFGVILGYVLKAIEITF